MGEQEYLGLCTQGWFIALFTQKLLAFWKECLLVELSIDLQAV